MDTTIIGLPLNRVEGRRKVTGAADYAADHRPDRLACGYGVMSAIASGEIVSLDAAEAEKAPGVLAVFHHGNMPKLNPCPDEMRRGLKAGEPRPPLQDRTVFYAGQFVALVVAESFAQARWAARLVRIAYRERPPAVGLDEGAAAHGAKPQRDDEHARGAADRALAGGEAQIDATYTTPVGTHNAIELHATVAEWKDGHHTLRDSTQWVVVQRTSLAHVLGLRADQVTVLAPFIGGGFGGKLFLWPHCVLAAVAARQLGRPVRVELTRRDQFTTAGHRPFTRQRVRLAARGDGKLAALRHDSVSGTSLLADYSESCGDTSASLYACPNVAVTQRIVPLNTGSPTAMRAPGAAPGTFALECAMDELAVRLRKDPLELRLANLPARDEDAGLPWSSNHLEGCLRMAADKFGWALRKPDPRSMRDGREFVGWGLAAASWDAHRQAATVRIELRADGSARASCATQDIGTGTATVIAQVVAELTTLPLARIEVVIGDSDLPPGPISGGSMVTATVVPAVAAAVRAARDKLFRASTGSAAAFAGEDPATLSFIDGVVMARNGRRETLAAALQSAGLDRVSAEARAEPGEEKKRYSFRSFGAHCVEVRWDPDLGRVAVARIVSVFDAGRIINRKTAANQICGSLVMGLGMALLEETVYDGRTGRVVTDNLADYHVPVLADLPELDVTFLDQPDPQIGDFGAKGLGEIGITGISAAIANAVYHASGRRIRDLPITVEKLLA